jgi:hypothetical protein
VLIAPNAPGHSRLQEEVAAYKREVRGSTSSLVQTN